MSRALARRLIVVALAVLVAACGVPTDREARRIPADELPFGLGATDLATTSTAAPPDTVPVETLRDRAVDVHTVIAGRLVSTPVTLDAPATLDDVIALVESPPSDAPGRSVLRPGDVLASRRDGSVVTVELLDTVLELPTSEQVLAVGQLVLTLTSIAGIDGVAFTVAGADAAVPLPDGSAGEGPITRDDVADLFAEGGTAAQPDRATSSR